MDARSSALGVSIPRIRLEAAGYIDVEYRRIEVEINSNRILYDRIRTGWRAGLVVIPCGDLLHQPLEVGPVERHGAVHQSVEQHTE